MNHRAPSPVPAPLAPAGLMALAALALIALVAAPASAQYLTPQQPQQQGGYLPQAHARQQLSSDLSRAEAPPQPVSFIGLAFDVPVGVLSVRNVDERLYAPNGAAEFDGLNLGAGFDVQLFYQHAQSLRLGLAAGSIYGGNDAAFARLAHVGPTIEVGTVGYRGFGFWGGITAGYARGITMSDDNRYADGDPFPGFYDYVMRGFYGRAQLRLEFRVAPFMAIRISPYIESVIRRYERITIDVNDQFGPPDMPRSVEGSWVSYGGMVGIVLGRF